MRIVTKRIKVIEMTNEEIVKFQNCMNRAAEGHTSHYAEEKLDDGSFLGVSVVKEHESRPMPNGRTPHETVRY
jgi:hypothetical protein